MLTRQKMLWELDILEVELKNTDQFLAQKVVQETRHKLIEDMAQHPEESFDKVSVCNTMFTLVSKLSIAYGKELEKANKSGEDTLKDILDGV